MRSTSRLSCSSWGWSSWPSTSSFTSATISLRRPWQPPPRRPSRAYPLLLIHLPTHLLSSHLLSSHLLSSHLRTSHLLSSHLRTSHLRTSHLRTSHLRISH